MKGEGWVKTAGRGGGDGSSITFCPSCRQPAAVGRSGSPIQLSPVLSRLPAFCSGPALCFSVTLALTHSLSLLLYLLTSLCPLPHSLSISGQQCLFDPQVKRLAVGVGVDPLGRGGGGDYRG